MGFAPAKRKCPGTLGTEALCGNNYEKLPSEIAEHFNIFNPRFVAGRKDFAVSSTFLQGRAPELVFSSERSGYITGSTPTRLLRLFLPINTRENVIYNLIFLLSI